ncbi:MAG TPA: glycosyltransferase, partial [Phycisphaeraceae bacterium]
HHGSAHFLRGMATELMLRGHEVRIFEPVNAWSTQHLLADHGVSALEGFYHAYPHLRSTRYTLDSLDLDATLEEIDLVIAHEWNDPQLIAWLGQHHAHHHRGLLLFHDTHHRAASAPEAMAGYRLSAYDGALTCGRVVRDLYLSHNWARSAWTWHEAADVRLFHPRRDQPIEGDVVWIANWGQGHHAQQIEEFLVRPVRDLKLRARVYGVHYPPDVLAMLKQAGIAYSGWLPNYRVPQVLARHRAAVHIPRSCYASQLPGVPTIRPFEALACGTPLVCAPWDDAEHLFTPGRDYLLAHDSREMAQHLHRLLDQPAQAARLAQHGLHTIHQRHTCGHRVDDLMELCRRFGLDVRSSQPDRPAA